MATVQRHDTLAAILDVGVLPVVRLDEAGDAVALARALAAGGIPVLEFTLTTPGALDAIRAVRDAVPDSIVGAGTVLDGAAAYAAIQAGAQLLITPTVCPGVLETGRRYGAPVFCGALTPTEILAAWEQGASCVKVFPASAFGPSYIKAVGEPLPQAPLMPSGGVTAANAGDFIRAGAVAVSAGGQLVDRAMVAAGDWAGITARALAFSQAVREARAAL
ncbi:MAG TPA: bifunctional 4-hydroxy-2-oxoglutarate aldolase/2-dehydro-3-deoxy-phosphogluconate aldolase [Chloroflexota bacterium]|nr:bifunctional 4-hydroxy-2-oxoglutarate aldolase/2-dehydro-3-deoxy-phosphogluconate aldolase [Chloroflexota bacterium]